MKTARYLLSLLLAMVSVSALSKDVRERADIEEQFKWDLASMYASNEAWEADFAKLQAMIPDAGGFKGRLGGSGEALLQAIKMRESLEQIYENLFVFAGLKSFEDQRVGHNAGMFSRARSIGSEVNSALAYFNPEFLAIPEAELQKMMAGTPGLRMYRHYLDQLTRLRAYTLSEVEERILAKAGDPLAKFSNVFSAIDNADLKFGTMLDEAGEEVELTKARYGAFLSSKDRRVRKDAWIGLFERYEELGNTLAANYEGHVKSRIFFADTRGYESARHASQYANGIPSDVYTSLVKTARDNVEPLQRYMDIRRRMLDVEKLQVWDLYAPIVEPVWHDVPWEDAKKIVAEGLAPLGDDYIALYWRGFDEGWVDAFENRGKRGGAYSWGTYTSKPYLSMNYEGTLTDLFTLAHEYGHSLHSYMSREGQPYTYASYRIFIAEVASMTNEAILLQKMLREAENREQKLALLQHYLDRFRAAFYRQASFADFEMQAHEAVEAGKPLTKDVLNTLYADVFDAYYGDSVEVDPLNASEWSRIPHFLRTDNFYVYQYATSFAAATALAKGILDEGQPAIDRFLTMLRSGDSDYPIELLKKAGVDMNTPQPILDTVEVFEELIAELEKTLAE